MPLISGVPWRVRVRTGDGFWCFEQIQIGHSQGEKSILA